MQEVDPARTYTVTVNRLVMSGTQNRVTISTSGGFLSLLFLTGPRTTTTVAPLIGFAVADQTGSTSYTGTSTAGTAMISELIGYSFLDTEFRRKVQGSVNIAASGDKEAIVFNIQKFWRIEFKYEPEIKVKAEWLPLMEWMIQQRLIEFTPEIEDANTILEGTLEKTSEDGKGLGYEINEMLPDFPGFYQSGIMTFRKRLNPSTFV
jgi:hypothetical protein